MIIIFGIRTYGDDLEQTEVMGDITAYMKPREGGGPSSISCPMLNTTNYTGGCWNRIRQHQEEQHGHDVTFPINTWNIDITGWRTRYNKEGLGGHQSETHGSRHGSRSSTINLKCRVRPTKDEINKYDRWFCWKIIGNFVKVSCVGWECWGN